MEQGLKKVRVFAEECGCTPQNIYGHLRTYAEDLEGHTIQGKGRQGLLLDEYAQEFLRSVMYPKELSTDTTVATLQEEIAKLRSALFQAGTQQMEMSARLSATEGERDRLLYDVKSYQKQLRLAEESEADKTARMEAAEQQAAQNAQEAQAQARRADDLERQLDQERAAKEAAEARERALKGRTWWERLTRKGE